MKEQQTVNNGKMWIIIGIAIAVIGLLFTIAMSVVSSQNIDRLKTQCENSGKTAEVVEKGFILTTSYEFTCKK
ncbi:hypothetical protein [Lysinibacillus odysseyi]|uniref:Uncharacterized protein n=1 Tax=Lysinibacillus odysseyi 34hs-1 = NBRC 100172 TaxID=1220589 RepID=A0A0A3IDF9_9BACI|nr:hypothetical protein [Lysinibacillus odysseyi]KGR81520.1 hypothetical protein CD32_19375 [Lysinibacillus odysseyi 34hs-1 = NBRC 100172]